MDRYYHGRLKSHTLKSTHANSGWPDELLSFSSLLQIRFVSMWKCGAWGNTAHSTLYITPFFAKTTPCVTICAWFGGACTVYCSRYFSFFFEKNRVRTVLLQCELHFFKNNSSTSFRRTAVQLTFKILLHDPSTLIQIIDFILFLLLNLVYCWTIVFQICFQSIILIFFSRFNKWIVQLQVKFGLLICKVKFWVFNR